MISINPVFQVLVTSGNQAVAAAGIAPEALLAGQLGVFDYDTNLSIDGTKAGQNQNIYILVGVNRSGAAGTAITGAGGDVMRSAGNCIKKSGVRAVSQKPYVAGVKQKFRLTFGAIIPDKDYNVKFHIENQEAYGNFGFNTPAMNFPLTGGPEVDSATGLASTVEFVDRLVALINGQDEKWLVASKISGTTTTGVVDVEVQTMPASVAIGVADLDYTHIKSTAAIVSMIDFGTDTSFAQTVALVNEEQSGREIMAQEYEAGGWNGNPGIYRVSDTTYLQQFESFANRASGYDTTTIMYDNVGIGGGEQYGSSLMTIIAVPTADDATQLAVKTLVNRLFLGGELFDAAAITAAPNTDGQTAG